MYGLLSAALVLCYLAWVLLSVQIFSRRARRFVVALNLLLAFAGAILCLQSYRMLQAFPALTDSLWRYYLNIVQTHGCALAVLFAAFLCSTLLPPNRIPTLLLRGFFICATLFYQIVLVPSLRYTPPKTADGLLPDPSSIFSLFAWGTFLLLFVLFPFFKMKDAE